MPMKPSLQPTTRGQPRVVGMWSLRDRPAVGPNGSSAPAATPALAGRDAGTLPLGPTAGRPSLLCYSGDSAGWTFFSGGTMLIPLGEPELSDPAVVLRPAFSGGETATSA